MRASVCPSTCVMMGTITIKVDALCTTRHDTSKHSFTVLTRSNLQQPVTEHKEQRRTKTMSSGDEVKNTLCVFWWRCMSLPASVKDFWVHERKDTARSVHCLCQYLNTSICTAFHKMNVDHEEPIGLVGEHGELLGLSSSQSGDSLDTDRDWAEAEVETKQTGEFNTF